MQLNIDTWVYIIGGAIAIIGWLIYLSYYLGQISVKVNTLWAFQMRLAFPEAISKGMAKMESPLQFNNEAMDLLSPIKEPLQKLWVDKKLYTKPPFEAAMEIERYFGPKLTEMICLPRLTNQGTCLLLALCVASGKNSIDLK